MKIAIAHAAWMPERERTLARLESQLTWPPCVCVSAVREHASVWARRLWDFASVWNDEHVVCLNDDVTVHPRFIEVIEALTKAVPDQVISLHCTSPVAPSFALAGERWLRSYWLTGPGYLFPPGAAKRLLTWIDTLPKSFVSSVNEDNLIMHWAWHEQRPIWHCIPALVQHDTSTASSLGYDNQPAWMRSSPVAWDAVCIPKPRKLPEGIEPMDPSARERNPDRIVRGDTITDPLFWTLEDDQEPMLVECPWMVRETLAKVERVLYAKPDLCSFCHRNDGRVRSQDTEAVMCGPCFVKVAGAFVGGVR